MKISFAAREFLQRTALMLDFEPDNVVFVIPLDNSELPAKGVGIYNRSSVDENDIVRVDGFLLYYDSIKFCGNKTLDYRDGRIYLKSA